jgi:hypothetical protein
VELPPGHRSVRHRLIGPAAAKPRAIFAIFASPHAYQSNTVPIIYGKDVLPWEPAAPIMSSPPAPAWRGQNGVGLTVQLFKSTWENPQPDVEIETLDFVSKMTQSAPFLVAITAEP